MFKWLFNMNKTATITLEEQLRQLQTIGITLHRGVTVNHLLEHTPREHFESAPYDRLLLEMGCKVEIDGEEINVSNCAWHEDTEIVEDHGIYADILRQLQRMSGLDIEHIEDYVDIEEEEAWVSFTCKGERVKWTIEVNDDWLDLNVLAEFSALIRKELGKRLVWTDCYGQFILVLCLTDEQLREVNRLVRNEFMPM